MRVIDVFYNDKDEIDLLILLRVGSTAPISWAGEKPAHVYQERNTRFQLVYYLHQDYGGHWGPCWYFPVIKN